MKRTKIREQDIQGRKLETVDKYAYVASYDEIRKRK